MIFKFRQTLAKILLIQFSIRFHNLHLRKDKLEYQFN